MTHTETTDLQPAREGVIRCRALVRHPSLVLSLFPGVGLFDMAFEEEGYCVVRGPDILWGGDVHSFHPPADTFAGMIGGPPCQAFSPARWLRAKVGSAINLVPEFERCVREAQPLWWVMENVPRAPLPDIAGYHVSSYLLDNRWCGGEQMRRRRFTFGCANQSQLRIETVALEPLMKYRAVLASDGKRAGNGCNLPDRKHTLGAQNIPLALAVRLQGFPDGFLDDAPFTLEGKHRVVGNGVPLPLGRAVAKAVRIATEARMPNEKLTDAGPVTPDVP